MLVLSLAACGSQNNDSPGGESGTSEDLQSDSGTADAESTSFDPSAPSPESSDKKILVVYFSATGNTKEAAGYIASVTGGDLFELVPTEPYSSEDLDWRDENSRVVYEHDHPDERKVALTATTIDSFNEYDTVFIGYPIWWGIAAWPVDGFIEANDFTGKTVIPFCTSASSGLGESAKLLKEAAGTGNWLEGRRFSSGATETEVDEWIKALGY
ncbi:MAG: flavodoxin [Clostridiales bacterium]|nr:flavodoxin [Clostridiales bacterium]